MSVSFLLPKHNHLHPLFLYFLLLPSQNFSLLQVREEEKQQSIVRHGKLTVNNVVIIIGLSLGLYGYDNAFVAPLLSLPLFIVKYQGVAVAESFTVSIQFPVSNNLLCPSSETITITPIWWLLFCRGFLRIC